MTILKQRTHLIKSKAEELGFLDIGISKAEKMEPEAKRLDSWLNANHHGQMSYMANHFDKRVDPTLLVPGAKSVISLSYNYHTEQRQIDSEAPKIAQYAYGKDYHMVIKEKLHEFINWIRSEIGEIDGRCFVDSAPVLERDWAKRSGLGWIGKNTLLLSKKKGSYFFLAEIISDLELAYDHPVTDHCGTCSRCIEACPTDAISTEGYIIDSRKCISYLTIELKDEIPTEFKDQMEGWMFGCDICQEVCPWNRFSKPHSEPQFEPKNKLLHMTKSDWTELTQEVFSKIFSKSAVKRTKFKGLKRNIAFLDLD